MGLTKINVGANANDGTGEPGPRGWLQKTNDVIDHVNDINISPGEAIDDALIIADEGGQVALRVNAAGECTINPSDETQANIGDKGFERLGIGNTDLQSEDDSGAPFEIRDEYGQVALRVNAAGEVDLTPSDATIDSFGIARSNGYQSFPMAADVNHILVYGQSLSVGVHGDPAITLSDAGYGALMSDAGVFDGQIDSGTSLAGPPVKSTGFAPLMYHAGDSSLEPPSFGLGNQLAFMAPDYKVVISNAGHTSYAIRQLDKEGTAGNSPTPQYLLAVAQSQQYQALANASGKSGRTQFIVWVQGETDERTTSKTEYKRRLGNLLDDYRTDTGHTPMLVTYQTGSHTMQAPNYNYDIALGQWEVTKERPDDFAMACATYVFTYNATDGEHLTNHGYRHLGCYFAKAIKAILSTGEWRPLEPERVWRQGRIVSIDFHVPAGPLVLDTDRISDPGSYGFDVIDADGSTVLPIAGVTVKNNHVTIALDADPSGEVTVTYALGRGLNGQNAGPTTGPRGCLRDSDTTLAYALDANGKPYELFNWCVMFSMQES